MTAPEPCCALNAYERKLKIRLKSENNIRLVVTAALKSELPIAWLKSVNVRALGMGSLKAGGVGRGLDASRENAGVLFVITGVGPTSSRAAAEWIANNIRPLYVVNIGSAGAPGGAASVGEWITPNIVTGDDGGRIKMNTRLPFHWQAPMRRKLGGVLETVTEPVTDVDSRRRTGCDYVDMEAYEQAKVFSHAGVSFNVIKMVTDDSSESAASQHRKALPALRDGARDILLFLKGVGEPDVSVVIPVHNREKWIRRCVESVLAQTVPVREVIVVDDGSTDGLLNELESFEGQIKIISTRRRRGPAAARNLGAGEAKGAWIAFLDSDDLWEKDKLERHWGYLRENPFYEISQTEEVWIRNGVRVNPRKRHEKEEGWIWGRSLRLCLVSPSAVMMKKTLFEGHGGFDESLPACEDYDLWIRISREKPVGLCPSMSVIKHGGHEDQLSRKYPAMDRFRVKALRKAFETEEDEERAAELALALKEKIDVLLNGARKRGADEMIRELEATLAIIEPAARGGC